MRTLIAFLLVVAVGCTTSRKDVTTAQAGNVDAPHHSPTISVFVLGEVHHPQEYSLTSPSRLSDAIHIAGGITVFAGRRVHLTRGDSRQSYVYYLPEIKSGTSKDPLLQNGDLIQVGRQL